MAKDRRHTDDERTADRAAQLAELADAIKQGWDIYTDWRHIVTRYQERTFADKVPRAIMYADMAILMKTNEVLEAEAQEMMQEIRRLRAVQRIQPPVIPSPDFERYPFNVIYQFANDEPASAGHAMIVQARSPDAARTHFLATVGRFYPNVRVLQVLPIGDVANEPTT